MRTRARDAAVAGLLEIRPGSKVALIGVVNPLVDAIAERGRSVRRAATGMTLSSNRSFDVLLDRCLQQEIPLAVYPQTGR